MLFGSSPFSRRAQLLLIVTLGLLLGGSALAQDTPEAEPGLASVGTGFTYQGRLTRAGQPVSATCAFQFGLFNAASGGSQIGSTQSVPAVVVGAGAFSALLNSGGEFGPAAFAGQARWLEIAVQCPGDPGFALLTPRQRVTPVPYAQYALSAPSQAPRAVLSASPAVAYISGGGSASVTLDLSASVDPAGGQLSYAFDPTGRAAGAPAFAAVSATNATYREAGTYLVSGWVRSAGGAVAQAQALVRVKRFATAPVLNNISVADISMTFVDGRPFIAYFDGSAEDLVLVRGYDARGVTWRTTRLDGASTRVGEDPSVATIGGLPGISYRDIDNGDMRYTYSDDPGGDLLDWKVALIDSAGNTGFYSSLADVGGRPAVAYYDSGGKVLKYARASTVDGSAWLGALSVSNVTTNNRVSLVVVDGNPAIAYYDQPAGAIRFVRSNTATGYFLGASAWGSPVAAVPNGAGRFFSLGVVDGNPAIAYYDAAGQDLKYVRATDAAGTAWGAPVTLDSTGDVGSYASLAVIDGRPAVAYADTTNANLKFVQARDASGSAWNEPIEVERAGLAGVGSVLAVIDGDPAIAHIQLSSFLGQPSLLFSAPRD